MCTGDVPPTLACPSEIVALGVFFRIWNMGCPLTLGGPLPPFLPFLFPHFPFPPSPSPFLRSRPPPSPSLLLPSSSPPLEVGPPKSSKWVWERCKPAPSPGGSLDLSHNTDNYHGGSEHPRRKGVGDRKGDWTGREREETKREEKWKICPGLRKAVGGNPILP